MVWRLHSWSEQGEGGEIVSPHFGPWPFGPAQNPDGITDFAPGEEVFVELDETADGYAVRSVVPARERQPAETGVPERADLAASDLLLEERTDDRLVFWAGDCCRWCSPSAPHVVFEGVTSMVGWTGEIGDVIDSALVRRASEPEIAELGLAASEAQTAYRIVTGYGSRPRGARVFVIASSVRVQRPAAG